MTGFIVQKERFFIIYYFIVFYFTLLIICFSVFFKETKEHKILRLLKLISEILCWFGWGVIFHLFSVSVFVFHDYPFCLQKGSISICIVSQRADRLRILIRTNLAGLLIPPTSLSHSFFFLSNQAAVIKARIKELIFHYIDACWTVPCFAFSFSYTNWTQRKYFVYNSKWRIH